MNRLGEAASPYLLQHADNPVDWWEWGPEALALAKELDRPILLSVGYAACHWCHVMAHESFEDAATAAYMNDHFVNIKVDREERPDIDAVYMQATQAMTGQGGWPMTVVLTPDGRPFFAGTYFPPEPNRGMPAFTQILQGLVDAWQNRREEVLQVGGDVLEHLRERIDARGGALDADALDAAASSLNGQHDDEAGGFGGTPKFPPSMVLEFLLRQHARTGDVRSLAVVRATTQAMARGGMYDQLGGGFARYSVDRHWQVPHFEKMLYDNALLLRTYLHLARVEDDPFVERIARETADFLLTELRTPHGGFASALDADSVDQQGEVHEGAYYVWNPNQLMKVLGAEDGSWAVRLLGVTGPGTFERGYSTLQLREDPDDPQRWADVKARLLAARSQRTRPERDDKVVAAWNGLAVTALAQASVLLHEPRYAEAAVASAELLATVHGVDDGRLLRTSRDGVAGGHAGVLEDHGCVAEAFLAVLGITGDAVWLRRASWVLDRVLEHFVDPEGGFFDTADDVEPLLVRPQDVTDNAYPCGTSAVAHAFLAAAAVTGEQRFRTGAESALASAAVVGRKAPRFAGWTLAAGEAVLAGPEEIAVVGPAGPQRDALHRAALRRRSPGAVVVASQPSDDVPLLAGRTALEGRPAAYVCRDFVCSLPTTEPDDLEG
ncbi:thioredoxin domain-containing protein [Aeromicrobium sp. CTD01-1L150]|uniref:thioredoxin domain-containing protein n=1 Tax=Aeromicrobium sp. CTD01-1L150 TaxID=3341830 RepID=UPI0035C0301F